MSKKRDCRTFQPVYPIRRALKMDSFNSVTYRHEGETKSDTNWCKSVERFNDSWHYVDQSIKRPKQTCLRLFLKKIFIYLFIWNVFLFSQDFSHQKFNYLVKNSHVHIHGCLDHGWIGHRLRYHRVVLIHTHFKPGNPAHPSLCTEKLSHPMWGNGFTSAGADL